MKKYGFLVAMLFIIVLSGCQTAKPDEVPDVQSLNMSLSQADQDQAKLQKATTF